MRVRQTVPVDVAKVRLLQERSELLSARLSIRGARNPVDIVPTDVEVVVAEMRAKKLAEIDRALTLMEIGTWGVCQDCGGRIESKRLDAKLNATTCCDCATKAEEEEKRQAEKNKPGTSFPPMPDRRR